MKKPRIEDFDPNTDTAPALFSPMDELPAIQSGQNPNKVDSQNSSTKLVSKEVSKFTSKLVDEIPDPPVNKVGYYFTRKEMNRLDQIALTIKQIMKDRYDIKVTKNDVVRACMAVGLKDWESNELTSLLVNFFTSKETS